MKGVILAAGQGTRLAPFTHTQPKPLLPVANKPVIQYGVEKLQQVGITDIAIVIHPMHKEQMKAFTATLRSTCSIRLLYQHEPKGIAHAISQVEDFVGTDPFVVLLGDNLIEESFHVLTQSFSASNWSGALLLAPVSKPQDYGIAEVTGEKIVRIEEKPTHPVSNLAVIGAYVFGPEIFRAIRSISPSARGEYEITDAIQWLINNGYTIHHSITRKRFSDVGTVERWLEANRWMLDTLPKNTMRASDAHLQRCTIIPPVCIHSKSVITDAVIGPYVSIDKGVHIVNCRVANSIILAESTCTHLPHSLCDSIIGQKARIDSRNNHSLRVVAGDQSDIELS